jgi:hypothetical protein
MLVMVLAASAITWAITHPDDAIMDLEFFVRHLLPFLS